MSTMGDYGSLLQLGFGIGIGLSLFQAPIELRYSRLSTSIAQQLEITSRIQTPKGRAMHNELSSINLSLLGEYKLVKQFEKPVLFVVIILALSNWASLIYVSLHASDPVSRSNSWLFLSISVFGFSALAIVIEIFVRIRLFGIQKRLQDLI